MGHNADAIKVKYEKELKQAELNDLMEDVAKEQFEFARLDGVKFSHHVAYADYVIEVPEKFYNFDQTILIAYQSGIPLYRHKDDCLSFRTERYIEWYNLIYNENSQEYTNKTGSKVVFRIQPYILCVNGLNKDEFTIKLYVQYMEYIYEVRIHINFGEGIRRETDFRYSKSAMGIVRKSCYIRNYESRFSNCDKYWASESYPNDFVLWNRKDNQCE